MPLLLVCGLVFIDFSSSSTNTPSSFLGVCRAAQITRGISVCGVCLWACHTLPHCHVTPAVWLSRGPGVVALCCVPRRLVNCTVMHVLWLGILGSLFPLRFSHSQIPSLPGTAQPSWREMPAANCTQVDGEHREVCVHTSLFACDSIYLCHRLHYKFQRFRTSYCWI